MAEKRILNGERGFTLIELIVVVVIIGMLAAVSIPQVSKWANKSRESSCKADLKSMKSVIEAYYTENGEYPDSGEIGNVMKEAGITWPKKDPWERDYTYEKISEDEWKLSSKGVKQDDPADDLVTSPTYEPTRQSEL